MSATVAVHEMLPAFILAGIGMGLVFAPSSTAVLANMAPADHAKASGTNSTLREIGVALGVAVLTAVFTGAGGELTPTGYVDAAIPAVLVGAAVLGSPPSSRSHCRPAPPLRGYARPAPSSASEAERRARSLSP